MTRRKRFDVLSRASGKLLYSTDSLIVAGSPRPDEVIHDAATGDVTYSPRGLSSILSV